MQSNVGRLQVCEAELDDFKSPLELRGSGTGHLRSKCVEDSSNVQWCKGLLFPSSSDLTNPTKRCTTRKVCRIGCVEWEAPLVTSFHHRSNSYGFFLLMTFYVVLTWLFYLLFLCIKMWFSLWLSSLYTLLHPSIPLSCLSAVQGKGK